MLVFIFFIIPVSLMMGRLDVYFIAFKSSSGQSKDNAASFPTQCELDALLLFSICFDHVVKLLVWPRVGKYSVHM